MFQHYKCAKMRAADTMSLQTPRFHHLMSLLCICCSSFVEGTTAPFFSFFFKGQISMRHERLCQGFATMLLFLMRRECVAGGGDRCRGGGPGGDPLFFALSSLVIRSSSRICHLSLCTPALLPLPSHRTSFLQKGAMHVFEPSMPLPMVCVPISFESSQIE